MTEAGKKWYVVRAVSGQEKKVKTYIDNEIVRLNLQDHVSQVLVPTEKVFQIRNGKKVSKEKNYFPGYIMVEADLDGSLGSEVEHTIKSIPGVIGFLGSSDKKAIPLRQQEVNRILGKVDELAEASEQINIPYIIGESVKVIERQGVIWVHHGHSRRDGKPSKKKTTQNCVVGIGIKQLTYAN